MNNLIPQKVKNCPDPEAAFDLLKLMKILSEDNFASGWHVDLEYMLWISIFDISSNFGFVDISINDRGKLLSLSHRCQGWWVWTHKTPYCVFVTYDEWLPMYQRYNAI